MHVDLYVDDSRCQTCDSCKARKACNVRAIVQFERGDLPAIDASRCRGCLVCRSACPHGALVIRNSRASRSITIESAGDPPAL